MERGVDVYFRFKGPGAAHLFTLLSSCHPSELLRREEDYAALKQVQRTPVPSTSQGTKRRRQRCLNESSLAREMLQGVSVAELC